MMNKDFDKSNFVFLKHALPKKLNNAKMRPFGVLI